MEGDDVEITIEHSSELCRSYSRLARLLGDQQRQHPAGLRRRQASSQCTTSTWCPSETNARARACTKVASPPKW